MTEEKDLQSELRRKANEILSQLSHEEREALLVKCWMSHDARWFMAVAKEYGMEVTNRLNKVAAHELGKAEARRMIRALQLPPVATLDAFLLTQEVLIGLLGPDLLDYCVAKMSDDAYQVQVRRCFAHENAGRAGILDQFECAIFARIAGWLDALRLPYETNPPLGKCLKARGGECVYTVTLGKPASPA